MQKQIILSSIQPLKNFTNKLNKIGIQGYPGDQFKINNGSIITIDNFGLYEIEANKYFIESIELIQAFKTLIIDYEEGEI